MWIAMFAIAAAHFPVEHLAGKPMRLAAGYAPNAVIHHLAEPGAWKWVVLNLAGSTTEAVVASFGMLVVALIAVCAEARSWRATFAASAPRATVLLSAAAGLFIALLMSAIFFVPPQRPDHIAYGRYALPAVLPFVAIGVLQFARGEGRYRRDMFLAVATGLACVALMAYAFTRLPANIASGWNYINAPFLYLAQNYLSFVSAWWAVAACFGVGALAVGVATWKSGRVAIAVFTLTGLAVAAIGWRSQTWHLSRLYSEHRHVIEAANAFEGITGTALCINLARQMVGWHGVDFRWRLLDHMADYRGLDDKPCVHAKVDHLKDGALDSPMRLVATERPPPSMNESVGLFVEPGPALEAWNRRMPAVATDSFYPIPESDRRAEVALLQPSAPVRSRVGSSVTLTVRVTNKSARRWAHIQDGPYPVWLGARAFEGEATLGEYRARFDHDVAPGESVDVDIAIGPFRKPGTFRINVGVLQEHVAWFPDRIDLLADVRP